jgi:flagellar biosynthesis/type III secretory pathway protein FliH
VVCPETWEIHLQEQREAKRAKEETNKAKREAAALRKANGEGKTTGKATGKATGKSKGKGKGKNKGKNNDQLTIETSEEAIDHEDDDVEAQLAAELEATTLTEVTNTTRSSRIRRAPVRYRNS